MQLEIEDLKTKVTRLTEQSTQHTTQFGILPTLSEKVDLAENQILRRRYRLPELTNDEDRQPLVTAVEVGFCRLRDGLVRFSSFWSVLLLGRFGGVACWDIGAGNPVFSFDFRYACRIGCLAHESLHR